MTTHRFSGRILLQLQKALSSAFRNRADLEQMVRTKLDENLDEIVDGANLRNNTFELIDWADAHGRLDELIEGAHAVNPGNPALKAFVRKWRTSHKPNDPTIGPKRAWTQFAFIGGVLITLLVVGYFAWPLLSPSEPSSSTSESVITAAATETVSEAPSVVQSTPIPTLTTDTSIRARSSDNQCVLIAQFDPANDELSAEIVRKIHAELTNGDLLSLDAFDVQIVDPIRSSAEARQVAEEEGAQIIVWGQIFQVHKEVKINFELTNQLGIDESSQIRPYRVQFFNAVAQSLSCVGDCFESADLQRNVLDQLSEIVAHTAAGLLQYGIDRPEKANQEFATALYCVGEEIADQAIDVTNVDCDQNVPIEGLMAGPLYYYAGRAKLLTGDYALALDYLTKAAEQNGDDPAPLIGIADVYRSWVGRDDLSEIRDALAEATRRTNALRADMVSHNASIAEIATVDYGLGYIAEQQQEWATAEEKYQLAIDGFGPENRDAYVTYIALARVQRAAGNIVAADTTLQQAHALDPEVPWALLERAKLNKNEIAKANEFIEQARDVAPNQAYVDIVMAELCTEWADFACAERAYSQASEKRPLSGWLNSRIGDFYQPAAEPLPHQEWSTAGEFYEQAVQERPADPWAHERLAFVLYHQGLYVDSAHHYTISLHELSHPYSQTAERYCNVAVVQQVAELLEDALGNAQICIDKWDDPDTLPSVEELLEQIQSAVEGRGE